MHTESSHRFERGVDPSDVDDVLGRTAELLVAWCGGTAGERTRLVGPGVPARAPATLRKARMDALLGVEVDFGEARAILERLGLRVVGGSVEAGELSLVPPHHRPDLAMEADCIEEVIRVHGIPQAPRAKHDIGARVTRAAIEVGLSQALVFGFTSDAALAAVGAPASHLRLLNPLTEDRSVMRTSLLPGLLEAVTRARRHNVDDARLFAVGARFLPDSTGARTPREVSSFAAVIAGRRDAVLAKPEPIDVWDAKGVALAIVQRATGRRAEATPQPADARSPHLHPRAAAHVVLDGQVVGSFGLLHPEVASKLDLTGPCAVVELCLETLGGLGVKIPRFRPIPALPAATRDLAVVVHDAVPAGQVERAIAEVGGELVESVELFDLFRGASIPEEHRSLAFHVVYRDPKAATRPDEARTLTDAEVDQRHAAVVQAVGERFGAHLRA
jgi:phenylalanyl-tRNA synthetase beta chain